MLKKSILQGSVLLSALLSTQLLAAGSGNSWLGTHSTSFGDYGYECLHCRVEYSLLLGLGQWDEYDPALRFDPETGKDLRNFPPDRLVDYTHMRLSLTIPDMNTRAFTATQLLVFQPIARPLETLRLNAKLMQIDRVRVDPQNPALASTEVSFSYDETYLDIRFDPPIPAGTRSDLLIDYRVSNPADGMFWITETEQWPDRPAQIHTQGQPETNRFWFPAHDFPNERLTTELIVAAPEGYTVVSNGRLVGEPRPTPGHEGLRTWRWLQDKDHVTYLVTLVVGKFDVVDVAPARFEVPLPVYVPQGKGPLVQQTFANTARMLELFERRFGEPYPWDKYANLVVWNFGAGGMENTSATSLYDTAVFDEIALNDADLDGLNSHELAHQWFGDLITCKSWEHIWLNEGWATYSTSLWLEERDGYQNGYLRNLYSAMRGLAERDQLEPGSSATRPGMVSPIYRHPWETFRRTSNPYPKGAATLHMLRSILGEDLFFSATAAYIDRHRFGTVETDDFRKVLEEQSGLSLEHFFTQWCIRPGTPRVRISSSWHESNRVLTIRVEQLQRIDPEHPAFVFDLPIEVYPEGSARTATRITIPVSERMHEYHLTPDFTPGMVVADPDLSVLMAVVIDQPASWLRAQAFHRSLASRLEATRSLRDHHSPATIETLSRVLLSTDEHWSVRQMAAESLGKLGEIDALLSARLAISSEPPAERAKVTASIVRAIGDAWTGSPAELNTLVAELLGSSAWSYEVPALALELLGQHGDETSLPLFERGLSMNSQHERIRRGALIGLRALGLADGLVMSEPYTRFGNLNRLRPEAIQTVASLSNHDRNKAFQIVAPLLRDTEIRTVRAASDALVTIRHPEGVRELDLLVTRTAHPVQKEEFRSAKERLERRLSGS